MYLRKSPLFFINSIVIVLCCSINGLFAMSQEESCPESAHPSSFGTSLFSHLCSDPSNTRKNVLVSPISISQSLTLLKDGATIESDNELELIQLLGPSAELGQSASLHRWSREMKDDDSKNSDVSFTVATSLWANNVKPSYIAIAKSNHHAEARALPSSYFEVNQWVADNTKGLITKLLDESQPVDQSMVAMIVNAVHFRGMWSVKFDPEKTEDGFFHMRDQPGMSSDGADGVKAPAKFMRASRKMKAVPKLNHLGGASIVVLDYGTSATGEKDTEFSSMFVLPASSNVESMNNVISGLKSRSIMEIINEAREMDVNLSLPRFKLNFGPSSLKESLINMGMTASFSKSGMFREMSEDPSLQISDVLHGATMEVTEEGTVAAAATAVIATRSIRIPFEMKFDRPFVVVVVHRPTGMPLFIGKVEEPELIFD